MNVRHTPVEKLVQRVEGHVEDWRKQDAARRVEAEAGRDRWWAEAREREKRLAETVSRDEEEEHPMEEATKKHGVAFVVHTGGAGQALDEFAAGRARLVEVVSGHRDYEEMPGFTGSWLIFEDSSLPEDGSV